MKNPEANPILSLARMLLPVTTLALAGTTLYMTFFYAERERVMGDVQRIFYFHAPAGIVCFLAFFVTFISSIAYLVTRRKSWDTVSYTHLRAHETPEHL